MGDTVTSKFCLQLERCLREHLCVGGGGEGGWGGGGGGGGEGGVCCVSFLQNLRVDGEPDVSGGLGKDLYMEYGILKLNCCGESVQCVTHC